MRLTADERKGKREAVVHLRTLGYNPAEIGRIMNLSHTAVRYHLFMDATEDDLEARRQHKWSMSSKQRAAARKAALTQ